MLKLNAMLTPLIGSFNRLLASYEVVAELAQSYLNGKPVDVFAYKAGS